MSWQAQYYLGTGLSGTPLIEQSEGAISLTSSDDFPQEVKDACGDPPQMVSARWTKSINGPGLFRFWCKTDDGMRIKVDGSYVINQWRGQSATEYSADKQLSAGPHLIIVEWYQGLGGFHAEATVTRIGGQTAEQAAENWDIVNQSVTTTNAYGQQIGRLTLGKLEPARFFQADDDGNPLVIGGAFEIFYCQINPVAYSISKKSKYSFEGMGTDKNYSFTYNVEEDQPRQLTIKELWFDTSEEFEQDGTRRDVSEYTDKLLAFAETTAGQIVDLATYGANLPPPPKVGFKWGSFFFLGVIETMKIKYTLFDKDGTALRAKVTGLKMTEFRMRKAYPNQNPTSGTEIAGRLWRVKSGERLDMIAARVYGDAKLWRLIATYNSVSNPLSLRAGQMLKLPQV